ncbi:MAG: class I SAM-dependent methyltransferase [Verrucomicrobia bacterium]|nr:class I SAM-dependent methyltransferase [Verrucomicrobiota bacterium]
MKERWQGFYALRIYLPLSSLSRRWRRFCRRIRNRPDRFLQATRLPEVCWTHCVETSMPRVCEHKKENGNVRVSELAILSALAARCRAGSNLFEIGTFDGRTTLNLALNAPANCRIYTLDLPPAQATRYPLADGERHMVEKSRPGARYEKYRGKHPAAISRIHQLLGDSANFDYSPYRGSCSLVFVDGSHAYDYALSDTRAAMTLVEAAGIIVWHDYGIWEGVTKALEELAHRERLGLHNIRGTSLVIWRQNCRPANAGLCSSHAP